MEVSGTECGFAECRDCVSFQLVAFYVDGEWVGAFFPFDPFGAILDSFPVKTNGGASAEEAEAVD